MCRDIKTIGKGYFQLPAFHVTCYLLAVLLSCKSVPPVKYEVPPQALPLDGGASVYISARVKEASSVINLIPIDVFESDEMKMMMDRTDYFCAAFFAGNSKKKMQFVSYGNYPDVRVRLALGANKNWKKMKSGWYSDMRQTSVYVTSKLAFASLWESAPENPVSSSTTDFPEGFDRNAPFSCWITDPGKKINSFMEKIGIPVQFPVENLFSEGYVEDDMFRLSLKLQFANASQARAVTGIINMVRLFVNQEDSGDDAVRLLLRLLTAKAPVVNDNYVNINPPLLSESDMGLLVNFLFAALW